MPCHSNRRAGTPGDDRTVKPTARGHDDTSRSVQEIPLAGRWSHFLSTPPVFTDTSTTTNRLNLFTPSPEPIQLLGGVSLAMAADVAETTQIGRPPRWSRRSSGPVVAYYSMRTKSSLAPLASWRAGHRQLGMTAQTTSWSARCCAEMSFRCGF